jgi:hypothetical protein
VATESYLGTARRRTSVRRHARLVDYTMHDGSNARAWVQVVAQPGVSNVKLKKIVNGRVTKLLTRTATQPAVMQLSSPAYEKALRARPQVFELMHDITLFAAHNEMKFYTWSALECCLPKGATRATLRGSLPNLKPGDVLILAEVRGPLTGQPEDADPTHRCAVRLIAVKQSFDPLFGPLTSPPNQNAVLLTEITWHQDDALPFALCISARNGTALYENVSVALGNIVLADHGLTIEAEELPPVPFPNPALAKVAATSDSRCAERTVTLTPPRFRPSLRQSPLSHAAPFDPEKPPASANATMHWATDSLLPVITLTAPAVNAEVWQPKRDLLSSHDNATEFVVEIETDGQAFLRFGDNNSGARPESGTGFIATYRTGNGVVGNIGADSLAHLVSNDAGISDQVIAGVRNPLPARGGLEPESMEQVRQNAPQAFRTQERAVTTDDYAAVALRCSSEVQRAAATMRWTGSWRTVFLTVDRIGGKEVDDSFETNIRQCLERFRMAGHDLEVDGPRYVPLEVEMIVCVKAGYLVSDVKAALLEVFSNRVLPDGRRGIFHPDNFTFGQPVFLSRLMAAAQAVTGVDSVEVTKFQRQGRGSDEAIKSGRLELGRLEIAQLDNDPNFRERGSFNLMMRGGR